ncbi:SDR family NAD(P)-dependent oxidoreductase [Kangiella sp. HD9-110m-PIT-SAG07]|nr:SDR family NAD(P)-dependent oxidoreductase [Kangiella sp. HD9-110m-PIT-SAG07]
MKTAIIFGASGGIGHQFVEYCLVHYEHVFACTRQLQSFQTIERKGMGKLHLMQLDPSSETELQLFSEYLMGREFNIQLLINACGLLHNGSKGISPEKKIEDFNANSFEEIIKANALITPLIAKHLLSHLNKGAKNLNSTGVFASLSARVGSIGDNYLGGWYSYRASKAALNQIIKTLSIEASRRFKHCSVIAIHPGTTDTNLSEPFQANVPAEKLFTPEFAINKMMAVIEKVGLVDSGKFYAWDGQEIEW